MDQVITFLLKMIITSGVMTAYYLLFLRGKKLHYFNRAYLLGALIVPLILPFIRLQLPVRPNIHLPGIPSLLQHNAASATGIRILLLIIILISALLLFSLFIQVLFFYRIKKHFPSQYIDGVYIIDTNLSQAPFVFLNNLFWRTDLALSDESSNAIYQHELTHIRQLHTYDKLFAQVMICVFWLNPFTWIIQKELNMVHEFLADEQSICIGDTEAFASMLLITLQKGSHMRAGHGFSQTPIRRRLEMVSNVEQLTFTSWRKWSILPVMGILFILLSLPLTRLPRSGDIMKQHDEKLAAEKDATIHSRK